MQEQNKKRFRTDRIIRRSTQAAIWAFFDEIEALWERWPPQARLLLNRAADPTTTRPFQTLAAKSSWRMRRRFNSVWTTLVCFWVHAAEDKGALEEMGLFQSEGTYDDVLDVMEAYAYNRQGSERLQEAVGDLCLGMLMDKAST